MASGVNNITNITACTKDIQTLKDFSKFGVAYFILKNLPLYMELKQP